MASIFSGANNEKACMSVMSNLKFKGECLSALHTKVNASIKLIEDFIVKNPTDDTKMLLLQTLELYDRSKCVATYKLPVAEIDIDEDGNTVCKKDAKGKVVYEKDKKGNIVYAKHSKTLDINTTDWEVSMTKNGVRVHLNKTLVKKVKDELSSIPNILELVVY